MVGRRLQHLHGEMHSIECWNDPLVGIVIDLRESFRLISGSRPIAVVSLDSDFYLQVQAGANDRG